MKLDFKNMDVATFDFRFLRALMVTGTGGAEINECLQILAKSKGNSDESWIHEWGTMAEKVEREAEQAIRSGRTITARGAYLRASNYYRTAMFSLPPTDGRLDKYVRSNRECFQKAVKLFSLPIETVEIPFGEARLPGYFLSAGQRRAPTLIAMNGGDSTNEEMVHWIGFAAMERGWNCLVFEGPGQWSAFQLNPQMTLRIDYEVPTKAVVDYLLRRDDVDPDKIALIGWSLASLLAARTVAFEKRICACILVGGPVVDVNEAWEAVWPPVLQKTISPGIFDRLFALMEKLSPQLAGFVNHYYWIFNVSKPHELIEAWRPFNIKGLAPKIQCPLLIMNGEAEYAQTDAKTILSTMRFFSELTCPVEIHEFSYAEGWAASHCQMGALSAAQAVIFKWLDKVVIKKDTSPRTDKRYDWQLLRKYHHNAEMEKLTRDIHIGRF